MCFTFIAGQYRRDMVLQYGYENNAGLFTHGLHPFVAPSYLLDFFSVLWGTQIGLLGRLATPTSN
jgi:hypothetical protein